ncbi:MAG TPA: multiheme c-type cytochrome, partial [bacterium]|nr:multiheme c-type cytochrome [bacterium]
GEAGGKCEARCTQSAQCLKCHVTTPSFTTEKQRAEGIGCERCHGPGSLYSDSKTMKNRQEAVKKRLLPLKGQTEAETLANAEKQCRECHGLEHKDENPAAKEFDFETAWPRVKHDRETLKENFPDKYK